MNTNNGTRWFSTTNGRIELELTLDDARSGSHQGPCDEDIAALRFVPYVAAQLDAIPAGLLFDELLSYGAWDESDLQDHETNLERILWVACCDITEDENT